MVISNKKFHIKSFVVFLKDGGQEKQLFSIYVSKKKFAEELNLILITEGETNTIY